MNLIQEVKIIFQMLEAISLVALTIYSIVFYFKNIAGKLPHRVKIQEGTELLDTFYL